MFPVAAEFLYHRIMGNAASVADHLHAVLAAPWWMPLAAAAAWLAGLKFLLSFSISRRRHLLLGGRFDPFFFRAPFRRYLGFLLLTYAWIVPLLVLSLLPAAILAVHHGRWMAALVLPLAAVAFAVRAVVRQVPFFTALALGRPHPGWLACTRAIRGSVARCVGAFVLAMLPIVLLDLALDTGLKLAGADRHAVHVAPGEAVFRQAMLFLHFALGAAVGAITTTALMQNLPRGSTDG